MVKAGWAPGVTPESFQAVPVTSAPSKSSRIVCEDPGLLCSAKVWSSGYGATSAPAAGAAGLLTAAGSLKKTRPVRSSQAVGSPVRRLSSAVALMPLRRAASSRLSPRLATACAPWALLSIRSEGLVATAEAGPDPVRESAAAASVPASARAQVRRVRACMLAPW